MHKFSTVGPRYAAYFMSPSVAYNFKVAPGFVKKCGNPSTSYCMTRPTLHSRKAYRVRGGTVLALFGNHLSASLTGHFTSEERASVAHSVGAGWAAEPLWTFRKNPLALVRYRSIPVNQPAA